MLWFRSKNVSTAAMLLVAAIIMWPGLTAAEQLDVSDRLAEVRDLYFDADFEKALSLTNELLRRPDVTTADSIAILEHQGLIYFSWGNDYLNKSVQCLERISKIDPCLIKLPRKYWPAPMADYWYKIADTMGVLTCNRGADTKVQTIAFWPLDATAQQKSQERLGDLGAGLAQILEIGFMNIGGLEVVERQKLDYLIREHQLAQGELVDQQTALKAGKMLSAHLMVFGSIIELDGSKDIKLAFRVTEVETSRNLMGFQIDGKKGQYYDLIQKATEELCKRLDITLSGDARDLIKEAGTKSGSAMEEYAAGLRYERQHEYTKAYKHFQAAVEADPDFGEARTKLDVYKPLVG
jgi:tetratricopeptide (TPR) repeat protein